MFSEFKIMIEHNNLVIQSTKKKRDKSKKRIIIQIFSKIETNILKKKKKKGDLRMKILYIKI
jgi:hypothetical protein